VSARSHLKILILGGYGTFGGRLALLLRDEPRLSLVIAGRSKAKAQDFCERHVAANGARVAAAAVDRDADLAAAFTAIAPHIVVDASGPFQSYGADPYRVAKAALGVRAHYMDLADGSDFVRNIVELDAAAKAANVFVLAGMSSFPALSAAAVRRLISTADIAHLDSIAAGVAPLPYAAVGQNVIRAIAAYAGRPVAVRRHGRTCTAYPLTETRRFTIAPPGFRPLPRTTFSLVDVPDLTLLADLWPEVQDIWVGAAPVPAIWHRLLRWLAWGVRARVLPSLTPLASLMYRTMNVLTWGERRGGMFVEVTGRRTDGVVVKRSWHLLAEGDDGPLIPCMAVEAVVRHMLDGRAPAPGARAAMREIEVDDYARAFARRTIYCGERQSTG
jgi:Saccharopine dehydrogenase NADP binding domain